MNIPIELQALDLLQEIAGYKTTDEILATATDEDTRHDLYLEDKDISVDVLNIVINKARAILKTGE